MRSLMIFAIAALLASPPLFAAEVPAHIAAAVAAPERTDADRTRDARDRPADILAFAGVAPGMKVADVFGGGGYWTELLSRAVGPGGSVLLVNNAPYFNYGQKESKPRFEKDRLPNVRVRTVETADMKFNRESLDLIVIFMSYHDIYWIEEESGWPEINADRFLTQLHDALKPGGKLLIVDHQAAAGSGKSTTSALHRIEESFAKQDIESHGFALDKTWDGFRNPSDDYSKLVFDPAVRGKTDRYTHLYKRR
jgi:predicted methyltransferase